MVRQRLFLCSAYLASAVLAAPVAAQCTDTDGDGFHQEDACGEERDCNDAAPATYPGAIEVCDGYDNDCDGALDEGCEPVCDDPVAFAPNVRVTFTTETKFRPSLVWTTSEYGVAWTAGIGEIFFARLDASGNKLGADVPVTNAPASSSLGSLVWAGSEYGVAWTDSRDGNYEAYFARLDAAGDKLGSDVRVTNDPADSKGGALVWTGSEYGLAWVDSRDGNEEIYFARLDAAGNKLGSDIRVTDAPGASILGSLVWTGSEYGLAWADDRDGNSEIYFARLDASGTKLDSDVRVTDAPGDSTQLSLVWTGSVYGVAWSDDRNAADEIYFASLDATGDKLTSDTLVTNAPFSSVPSLVWTGSAFGVAWGDYRDALNGEIYFARLDAAGNKLGADVRVSHAPTASFWPSLVWAGNDHGVAWLDNRDGHREVYFSLWKVCCDEPDADGDGFRICIDCDDADVAVYPGAPQLCGPKNNDCQDPGWPTPPIVEPDGDGDGYTTCHGDCNDANATTHPGAPELCDGHDNDCDGALHAGCEERCEDPAAFGAGIRVTNAPSSSYELSLTWTGTESGVAWRDHRDGNDEIYFTRLDAVGNKIGSDVRVTNAAATSRWPSIVWTGSGYGVAWSDARGGTEQIYFARLDAAGNKLGSDVLVPNAPSLSRTPSLVWTGSEYGVAWSDNRDGNFEIYVARLDAAGGKVGSDIRLTNAPGSSVLPSVVWTGSESGIAWSDSRHASAVPSDGDYNNSEIYFARLDAAGNEIGSEARMTNAPGASSEPSLVWTGSEYGIAWNDSRDPEDDAELYFARVDAVGSKVGSNVRVTRAPRASLEASLVWTGSDYGIAWRDRRDGNDEIYFARLDAAGNKVEQDVRVTNNPLHSVTPSALWTGSDFGVAWADDRDGNYEIYYAAAHCCDAADDDGDGFGECAFDCDDGSATVYPGAPEACDGLASDCAGPAWPGAPASEIDLDGDGLSECAGDCLDTDSASHPLAPEICDGVDNDCDGLLDEAGDVEDGDADRVHDGCDNCLEAFNPSQSDRDEDAAGDACDLDDGLVYLRFASPALVEWTEEQGHDSWNVYRGDLAVLAAEGVYSQEVGGLAWRACGVGVPALADGAAVPPGAAVFYLVTGVADGVEGSLGTNGEGAERPNGHPCP